MQNVITYTILFVTLTVISIVAVYGIAPMINDYQFGQCIEQLFANDLIGECVR